MTNEEKIIKYFGAFICNSLSCQNTSYFINHQLLSKKERPIYNKQINEYITNADIDFSSELNILEKACEFYKSTDIPKKCIREFCVGELFVVIKYSIFPIKDFKVALDYINNAFIKSIISVDYQKSNIKFCSNLKSGLEKEKNIPYILEAVYSVLKASDNIKRLNALNKIKPVLPLYKTFLKPTATNETIKEFELMCQKKIDQINLRIDDINKKIKDKELFRKTTFLVSKKNNINIPSYYKLEAVKLEYNKLYMDCKDLHMKAIDAESPPLLLEFTIDSNFDYKLKYLECILLYQAELLKCVHFLDNIKFSERNKDFKKIVGTLNKSLYIEELEAIIKNEISRIKIDIHKNTISVKSMPISSFSDKNSLCSIFETMAIQDITAQFKIYIEKIENIINEQDTFSISVPDPIDKSIIKLIYDIENKGITTYVAIIKGRKNKNLGDNIENHPAWKLLEIYSNEYIKKRIQNLIDTNFLLEKTRKASFGKYTAIVLNPHTRNIFREYKYLTETLTRQNGGVMPFNKKLKISKSLRLEDILTDINEDYVVPDEVKLKKALTLRKLITVVQILENEMFFDKKLWKSISCKLDSFPPEFLIYLEFKLNSTDNPILKKNLRIIINEEKKNA